MMHAHTCRYEDDEDGRKKMHRHIDNDDVIDYSSGARKKNIKMFKDEDIEYRDSILQRSSGNTVIKIKEGKHQGEEHRLLSDAFSAIGSYTLDLQNCYVSTQNRHKRSSIDQMDENLMEENLKAHFDRSEINNYYYVLSQI